MKEKRTEVRSYEVRAYCDCGGEFVRTNRQKLMSPPLNVYVCDKCGSEASSPKSYPQIQYEPVSKKEQLCIRCGALGVLDGAFLCASCYRELAVVSHL